MCGSTQAATPKAESVPRSLRLVRRRRSAIEQASRTRNDGGNKMTTRILAMVKPLALSIFAIGFFALAQGVARADEVFIAGFTNRCLCGASSTRAGPTF